MSPSKLEDFQQRIIEIKAEYDQKMQSALNKVRKQYKKEYKQFIEKMNLESDEVRI